MYELFEVIIPSFFSQLIRVPDSIVGDNAGSSTLLWEGSEPLAYILTEVFCSPVMIEVAEYPELLSINVSPFFLGNHQNFMNQLV